MAQDPLRRRLAFAAVVATGVGCEALATQPLGWSTLDLAVGLGAAIGGLLVWPQAPRAGAVSLVLGLVWFCGTLSGADWGLLAAAGNATLLAYRGPLLQLLLQVPDESRDRRALRALVASAWVAAVLPFSIASPVTAGLAVVVAAVLVRRAQAAPADSRGAARAAAAASVVLAAIWAVASARLTAGSVLLVVADLAVLAAVGVALAAASGFWVRGAERALVIELGPSSRPGLPLTTRIARALADPDLEIRYALPGLGWVDERGRGVPELGEQERLTRVAAPDGGEVVLVHGALATGDSRLANAAAAAAALSLDAARLEAEVRARAHEVDGSRLRLMSAADEERRDLATRLSERVLVRLRGVDRLLAHPSGARRAERDELAAAVAELVALGRGLYPPALARADLAGALRELAQRSPVQTTVEVDGDSSALPEAHRAAVWFVCSEALTNVARHSSASSAEVRLRVAGDGLGLEVEDDGRGGAAPARGLLGLADRIEALGGRLSLSSPAGGPTVLRVDLPRGV